MSNSDVNSTSYTNVKPMSHNDVKLMSDTDVKPTLYKQCQTNVM